MSSTLKRDDSELVQQYVRDLQVLAGHLPANVHLAEQLLIESLTRLAFPSCPAAQWTLRGLTVTALTRVAGPRSRLVDDWDHRLQQVWFAGSIEDLHDAVTRVVATLRACHDGTPPRNGRAAAALEYMRAHIHEPSLSLDGVSATVRLSRWHLCRVLRRETGATYRGLVHQMRLERACELLRDPLRSVKEVAAAAGYSYSTELDRDFRRAFGESPTQWRRRVVVSSG
jgi:AraC-like DNA-binding protein